MASTRERLSHLRTKPLTARQERRLVSYLDDEFLQLMRGYKKRTSPSTIVPTLYSYLAFARRLLALILQIPPVDPSTSLRTAYLLRLTGEVLNALPGYDLLSNPERPSNDGGPLSGSNAVSEGPDSKRNDTTPSAESKSDGVDADEEPKDYRSALRYLLDWLDDLDQAWLAVLQSQVWDPEAGEGVDLILDVGNITESEDEMNGTRETHNQEGDDTDNSMDEREGNNSESSEKDPPRLKSTPMSQTEVTRLRSLLVTSMANLEDWLGKVVRGRAASLLAARGEDDVGEMLERLGLLDEFDELFSRTLDFLGGFGGYTVEPDSIVEDMHMEVEMGGCS